MADELEHALANGRGWLASIEEMLAELNREDAEWGSNEVDRNREKAEQTIHESVLSVLVRDGWHEPGKQSDDGADEYEILLSTGGPALRIWGKLNKYSEPERAELQVQDWFKPWTRCPAPEATLLEFARCFYFGE